MQDGTSDVPLRRKKQLKKRDGTHRQDAAGPKHKDAHTDLEKNCAAVSSENNYDSIALKEKLPSISTLNVAKLSGRNLLDADSYNKADDCNTTDLYYSTNSESTSATVAPAPYSQSNYRATFVQTIGNGTRIECSQVRSYIYIYNIIYSRMVPVFTTQLYIYIFMQDLFCVLFVLAVNFSMRRRNCFQRWKGVRQRPCHSSPNRLQVLNILSLNFLPQIIIIPRKSPTQRSKNFHRPQITTSLIPVIIHVR